jgi:hypothetical protein
VSRIGRPGDDTGSMAMALLLIMVGVSLTSLVMPVFIVQRNATSSETRRVDAINAAQTGLEYGLGQIRAARDSSGNGVLASLPTCGGLLSGSVGGASVATFSVRVQYFNAASTTTPMCSSGKPATTPKTAVLTAAGVQSGVTRTLSATYTFQSTNANIPGGLIRAYKTATSNDLCFDASSAQPAVGTILKVRTCNTNLAQQKFAYYDDLTIVLVNSNPAMCVDADVAHAAGKNVRLNACVSPAPARQRWVANGHANFEGTADSSTRDGYCLNVKTPNLSGSDVILGSNANSTCQQDHDNQETFIPEAEVGAGAAGPPQLVNYSLFGRCIDVPGGNNYGTRDHMIAWPCKQVFDRTAVPSQVAANESWTIPAKVNGAAGSTGYIRIIDDGADNVVGTGDDISYCLQSPGVDKQYPILVTSCSSLTTNKKWTAYWDTGDYSTSYRIKDGYGLCLQPTDPEANPPDFHGTTAADFADEISKIIVATCTTEADDQRLQNLQKWNAPANATGVVPLKNVTEN